MRYSVKDVTIISLTVGLTVALGYVFYIIGSFLPIPGHKFIIFAPFFGFVLFIPLYKIKKVGVMTLFSLVFGFIMTHASIFMPLAITLTGISADIITLILFQNYKKKWKIIASIGFYPVAAIVWVFIVSYYLIGNPAYAYTGSWFFAVALLFFVYILGTLGAYLCNKFVYTKMKI